MQTRGIYVHPTKNTIPERHRTPMISLLLFFSLLSCILLFQSPKSISASLRA
ncbi:hypothetical protein BDV40DRAFT_282690 [Aspergillus tamarii]|uniref:Uncharacterized protein n=1 Tax=Aspergillus tamarii TaxID=41984 RepID=A0A5N6UBD6_ASPTM|nr:hypothetical protein BDV40DRAFT_282690 [Aspergillus tamarii]